MMGLGEEANQDPDPFKKPSPSHWSCHLILTLVPHQVRNLSRILQLVSDGADEQIRDKSKPDLLQVISGANSH